MGKKWHTNKTKPRAYEEFIVITKDNHDFPQVELEMIRTDDFHKNIIPDEWWETVILWQYVDKLFAKEFKEIELQDKSDEKN